MVDFSGGGMSNFSASYFKILVKICSSYYIERLKYAIIFPTGWLIRGIYNIIKTFIDKGS
jgi:hypothetical protein